MDLSRYSALSLEAVFGTNTPHMQVWSYLLHRDIHTYVGHSKPISGIDNIIQ